MQVSATLAGLSGVDATLVAMGTGVNLDLLADMGFTPPSAGPNDLVVAVAAVDEAALASALERLAVELTGGGGVDRSGGAHDSDGAVTAPRTVGSAVRRLSGAGRTAPVVLVSTPGRHAFVEAMDALDAGASVMVFSDNVPLAQEVALKTAAEARDLLVMGPDCGTAVVGGVGLGFATVVRPGPVGLVAASGTGAQQVMALLAWAGVGVSHCLGVGGRDLSAAVAGRSTFAALRALDDDAATEIIVVLSKPPDPDVATALTAAAAGSRTPVVVAPVAPGRPDLTEITEAVLRRLGHPVPAGWPVWAVPATGGDGGKVYGRGTAGPVDGRGVDGRGVDGRGVDGRGVGGRGVDGPRRLRGLFSGGTLCAEAMAVTAPVLGPIASNVPIHPEWTLGSDGTDRHSMVDLGADEFTVGRPHPMIDLGPRLARMATADGECVLLLDVVLGHGAHPDPAAELAPALVRAVAAGAAAVVSLIGGPDDPQDVAAQAAALSGAGATVFASNAEAARYAAALAGGGVR
jgi:FdrA protein